MRRMAMGLMAAFALTMGGPARAESDFDEIQDEEQPGSEIEVNVNRGNVQVERESGASVFPVLPWRGAASGSPSGGSSVFPVLPWRGAAGGPASQAPANALRPLDDPDAPVAGDSVDAELPGEGPEDLSGPDDDDDLPE